jgi:hypothetical protein
VVVAIVLVSLVALGGIGYGVYSLLGGGKKGPPAGWKEYTYKDEGFKAYFPQEPTVHRDKNVFGGNAFGAGGAGSVSHFSCGKGGDSVRIEIEVIHFASGLPSQFRDAAGSKVEGIASGIKVPGLETRSVTWLGVKATEVTTPQGMMRLAITEKGMYQATIGAGNGRAKPDEEAGFFDNFQLVK